MLSDYVEPNNMSDRQLSQHSASTLSNTTSINPAAVSVVMSVFKDAVAVVHTVESVFAQLSEPANAALTLEFVIVDDGADDEVKTALQNLLAQHPEIVLHSQNNQGLTKALIIGCELAKHPFIARIDAGDVMLSGRLSKQTSYLQQHTDVAAVSSWTRYRTREGQHLYDVKTSQADIQASMALQPTGAYASPLHFTIMFRRELYQEVGAYRAQFYFAQDFDLWLRLSELGRIDVLETFLTESEFTENAISGAFNAEQVRLLDLAVESARLRRQAQNDDHILEQVASIRPRKVIIGAAEKARALYFIGSCLLQQNPALAQQYFCRSIKQRTWFVGSWLGLLRAIVKTLF